MPKSALPATLLSLRLLVPPVELIPVKVAARVPLSRFKARPLVLMEVSFRVRVPKLVPVKAVLAAPTLPNWIPRIRLLLPRVTQLLALVRAGQFPLLPVSVGSVEPATGVTPLCADKVPVAPSPISFSPDSKVMPAPQPWLPLATNRVSLLVSRLATAARVEAGQAWVPRLVPVQTGPPALSINQTNSSVSKVKVTWAVSPPVTV